MPRTYQTAVGSKDVILFADTIMGVDPGISNFGWAIYDPEKLAYGVIKPDKKESIYARLFEINKTISDLIGVYNPDAYVMEKVMLRHGGPNMLNVYAASMVAGMVAHTMMGQVSENYPTSTKKILLKKGVATKSDMKKFVSKIFDIEDPLVEHEADALGQIAVYILENEMDEFPVYKKLKETTK
jgi:Holliday junction resolvasome RuvABC endonuclease subunit